MIKAKEHLHGKMQLNAEIESVSAVSERNELNNITSSIIHSDY